MASSISLGCLVISAISSQLLGKHLEVGRRLQPLHRQVIAYEDSSAKELALRYTTFRLASEPRRVAESSVSQTDLLGSGSSWTMC